MTSRSPSGSRGARRFGGGPFASRRAMVAGVAVLVALAVAPTAIAHGTLTPTTAVAGVAQRFELTVPNDRLDADLVAISVALPEGGVLESAEAQQPRWTVASDASTVRWTGGPVERGSAETFAFVARMPADSGPAEFSVVETYDDGDAAPFPLTVAGTSVEGAAGGDADAMATIAVVLAALALAVSTIALVLVARTHRSGT